MCVQNFLLTIPLICEGETPYFLESLLYDTPCSRSPRIDKTCSEVNLALLFDAPLECGDLPLVFISFELSCDVPLCKCSGFQHGGLSHLCRTKISFERIQSLTISKIIRWTPTCLPFMWILPCPSDLVAPFHIQHPHMPKGRIVFLSSLANNALSIFFRSMRQSI